MRSQAAAAVFGWVAAQPRAELYTTSVNKAEVLYGIAALPDGPHGSSPWAEGPRRTALAAAAEALFTDDFAGRVLPFDEDAAVHYAEIVAARRREGRPIEAFDAQIAARPAVPAPNSRPSMSGVSRAAPSLWSIRGKRHD
jgi:predicted nucleic acid-binding protein